MARRIGVLGTGVVAVRRLPERLTVGEEATQLAIRTNAPGPAREVRIRSFEGIEALQAILRSLEANPHN